MRQTFSLAVAALLAASLAAAAPGPRIALARAEDGKVTLFLAAPAGTDSFSVRVTGPGDSLERLVDGVEVTRYAVHGLRNGARYRFSVAAWRGGRRGPWSAAIGATPTAAPDWPTLEQAFRGSHPFKSASPFLTIHGDETPAELRRVLRECYRAGFEGVTLLPYQYADFLGEGQWSRWRVILEQARRLGLCVWEEDDQYYPSGFAAGKVVAAHPEFRRTHLAEAVYQEVDGGQAARLDLRPSLGAGETLVSLVAFPASGQPIDLLDRVCGGVLDWPAPPGRWRVAGVKAVREGGPYIDFMCPEAVDEFIRVNYGATYARFRGDFGKTFQGFFTDEAPVSFNQWTHDMEPRFRAAKGYALRARLPMLLRDLGPGTEKLRSDFRDFVREQNAAVFFGRSRDWCRAHGVRFIGHVIEDHQQDQRRLEFLDIPGCDHIFDFWYRPDPDMYWRQARMASSVAHYCGAPGDRALIEHFAATGWRTGLTEMKRMMDWSTVFGINQVVPCGIDTKDPPDWEIIPDFWLHGRNPQWPFFPLYQAAADRMTMLMRGGVHVAPVLVLDTTEAEWAARGTSLDCPHAQDGMWRTLQALGEGHLDHDLVPGYVFADRQRTRFAGGRIRLARETYRAVVVPPAACLPPAVLHRLAELRRSGGIVICVDRAPAAVLPVIPMRGLAAHLVRQDIADVVVSPGLPKLLVAHRRLQGRDVYFVANTGEARCAAWLTLRGVRGTPALWDPDDGTVMAAPRWQATAAGTRVHLDLPGWKSLFVVVDPADRRPAPRQAIRPVGPPRPIVCSGPWTVTEGDSPSVATFETVVRLPATWRAGRAARLEVGQVTQAVSVEANGHRIGTRFTSPYAFEAGPALRPGANRVVVRQVERWGTSCVPQVTVDDPRLTFTGAWIADQYPPTFNRTRHYTNEAGAAFEVRFRGTGFSWVGERADNRGLARVIVDGKEVAQVDTFADGPEQTQASLYSARGLPYGEHTVRVVCLGRAGARSKGAYISVDGLKVSDPASPTPGPRLTITP